MSFQTEMYRHLIDGRAGEAAPILARLCLCAGSDPFKHPCSVWDLHNIGSFSRPYESKGLNEFFALECVRAIILDSFKPWAPEQIQQLEVIAAQDIPLPLSERYPLI